MFHYRQAARKLEAANRTHPVSIAFRRRLIRLAGDSAAWELSL
jgi:hypothetical protein